MNRPTFAPLIICDACKWSMHDNWGTRKAHTDRCHSSSGPQTFSYPLAADVLAAGWAREDFTSWPYPADSEEAFWQAHYALAAADQPDTTPYEEKR